MAVKIISKEIIQPSNPTPPHMRNFKTCVLDQISPLMYVPLIFFYSCNLHQKQNISEVMLHLKNSLSMILCQYYPLAGRMKDSVTIDCNDLGVPFIVAHMSCCLNELLINPPIDSMCDFVPFKVNCDQDSTQGLVGIQVTTFDCGGIVIGVCMHHRTTDATSMSNFIKSWAREASIIHLHTPKDKMANSNLTTAQELFPSIDSMSKEIQKTFNDITFMVTKLVERRYVFDKNAISSLQAKSSNELIPKPTRNQALVSFIWKHMMEASRIITNSSFTSLASVIVNLRPRFMPPLSSNCYGNLYWFTLVPFFFSLDGQKKIELSNLAHSLKLEVARLDSKFIPKLQQPEVIPEILQRLGTEMIGDAKLFVFSNWCNLGHYDIDFGWGRPVWIAHAHRNDILNYKCTFLLDSPSGIEVWVTAEEAEISILEKNLEFLEFVSINPSVIPY